MAGVRRIPGAVLVLVATLAVAACANERGPHPNLPPLGVAANFTSRNLCGLGVSPEINIGNAPQNVAVYRLRITEVSTLRGPRWQTDIPAKGNVIPEGALEGFDLPCPGEKQRLSYRLEVMALAADTTPLAYGWGFSPAMSLPEQIEAEQKRAKRGESGPSGTASRPPPFFLQ
jgi:hypothetical protein